MIYVIELVLMIEKFSCNYTNMNFTDFTSGQIHITQDLIGNNKFAEKVWEEIVSLENVIAYTFPHTAETLSTIPEQVETGNPSVGEHYEAFLGKAEKDKEGEEVYKTDDKTEL